MYQLVHLSKCPVECDFSEGGLDRKSHLTATLKSHKTTICVKQYTTRDLQNMRLKIVGEFTSTVPGISSKTTRRRC